MPQRVRTHTLPLPLHVHVVQFLFGGEKYAIVFDECCQSNLSFAKFPTDLLPCLYFVMCCLPFFFHLSLSLEFQVSTFYTYGCNSGVPSPRETEFVDELAQFCGLYGPNMSVPCLETQVTVFGGETCHRRLPVKCLYPLGTHL